MPTLSIKQALEIASQFKDQGKFAEAEDLCRNILASAPAHLPTMNLLGIILGMTDRLVEARDLFRAATHTDPTYVDAWRNLGLACEKLEELDEAVSSLQRAVALAPDYAHCWRRLGVCLGKQGQMIESVENLQKSLQFDPLDKGTRYDLVFSLCTAGRFEEASVVAYRGLDTHPKESAAINILANSYKSTGRFKDAVEAWRHMVETNPADSEARGQLALTLLTIGDFENGWKEYEHRWALESFRPNIRRPVELQWGCEQGVGHPDLNGRTLLIYSEQGMGDTIQFVRYASTLAARGARILVECQWPLKSLIEKCPGVRLAYGRREPIPKYDWHIPMASLPLALGTTLQTIPAEIPYIKADPSRAKNWQVRVTGAVREGTRLRVGLAWAGNPTHLSDKLRSIDGSLFATLGNLDGISFFSLQKPLENRPLAPIPNLKLIDFTKSLYDFAETAALIDQLDLVISVDTAVAHLAGAMGKPVWVLLPFVPDFRWMLDREDSPWYPAMRLFRQKVLNDWTRPINSIVESLRVQVSGMNASI